MISTLSVRRFCTPPTIAVASDSWRLFGPSMAIIAPVTSSDATLESWNRPSSASTMPVDDPLSTRMTVVRRRRRRF